VTEKPLEVAEKICLGLSADLSNSLRLHVSLGINSSIQVLCVLMRQRLANGINKSPENTVEILFSLAMDPETNLDDFLSLTNSAVVHLSDVRFQRHMITQQSLEAPLSILVESYSRFSESDLVPSISGLDISSLAPHSEEPENEKLLAQMRLTLIESLSEISALPEFAAAYALDSPLIGSLRMWLTVPHTQLQVCACLMLGNLARSDNICQTMVHDFRIHEPLIAILEDGSDSSALHAAIGFLKNLGLLADNKVILGKARLLEVLSRLWALETMPVIQFASAGLARQIISGSRKSSPSFATRHRSVNHIATTPTLRTNILLQKRMSHAS
jgi:hypothetical protein